MTEPFNPGDTVRLRSGSPVMTVNEKAQGGAGLVCVWFDGNDVRHHAFKTEALEAAVCKPAAEGAATAGR